MDESVENVLRCINKDAHPMSQMVTCFAVMSGVYTDANPGINASPYKEREKRLKQVYRVLGQSMVIAANIFRRKFGLPMVRNYEYNSEHS